jgi:hypothetical protein
MNKSITKDEAKSKIYELARRLRDIEKEKRIVMADFKDRLNDVKSEMEEIISDQESANTP